DAPRALEPKVERVSSDQIAVTSYSQNSAEPSFYTAGKLTPALALKAVHDAHHWSNDYDPAWLLPAWSLEQGTEPQPSGSRMAAGGEGGLVEPEATGMAEATGVSSLLPDPSRFDERFYLFNDLTAKRKMRWLDGRPSPDPAYKLKIINLDDEVSWRTHVRGTTERYWDRNWTESAFALTVFTRYKGCKKKMRELPIACDTGGWFPIEELLGRSMGRNTISIAMLLNIVARDDKGRFQISALVDSWGNLFDYFAVRSVSGHGIPWLDPYRFGCPITEADLENYGCITHVTQVCRLTGIFRLGIIPGGSLTHDSRAETDFGCYFYDDRRH
ncbi:MAG: RNA 2'-phosphotransferase, partial [Planctomycetaceae bacterium]|nr:RNA 2'-phosphotransferase [Planctomycetaceae bacterium]